MLIPNNDVEAKAHEQDADENVKKVLKVTKESDSSDTPEDRNKKIESATVQECIEIVVETGLSNENNSETDSKKENKVVPIYNNNEANPIYNEAKLIYNDNKVNNEANSIYNDNKAKSIYNQQKLIYNDDKVNNEANPIYNEASPAYSNKVNNEANTIYSNKVNNEANPIYNNEAKPVYNQATPVYNDFNAIENELFGNAYLDTNPIYANNPITDKLTGIVNAGNTCFMNTALQCLFSLRTFVDMFYSKKYEEHINTENKRGYGGRVSNLFYELLQEYANASLVRIDSFKKQYSTATKKFADYEEQDAFEFTHALLDDLHEDLLMTDVDKIIKWEERAKRSENYDFNSIFQEEEISETNERMEECLKKNKATEVETANDYNTLDELENGIAMNTDLEKIHDNDEVCNNIVVNSANITSVINTIYSPILKDNYQYLSRNTSVVNMLFTGQSVSKTECSSCKYVNSTPELFNILSLDIPGSSTIMIQLYMDTDTKPVLVATNYVTVEELESQIRNQFQLKSLLFVSVRRSKLVPLLPGAKIDSTTRAYEYDDLYKYKFMHLCTKEYFIYTSYVGPILYVRVCGDSNYLYSRCVSKIIPFLRNQNAVEGLQNRIKIKMDGDAIIAVVKKEEFEFENNVYIEDLIRMYEKKDRVVVDCYCSKEAAQDQSVPNVYKSTKITNTPFYLIIHLNRLNNYEGKKNNLHVEFNDFLSINNREYRLVAFANHYEIGYNSGHYTATVLKNNKWYVVNDMNVMALNIVTKSDAYMLFYELIY